MHTTTYCLYVCLSLVDRCCLSVFCPCLCLLLLCVSVSVLSVCSLVYCAVVVFLMFCCARSVCNVCFPSCCSSPSFAICNVVLFPSCVGVLVPFCSFPCWHVLLVSWYVWWLMPAGVFHMHACLIVHTYVRVWLLSRAYFARDCVCVCSCVFVSTMLNLPFVVCRRRCVSLCMYLRAYVHMYVYVWSVFVCICICMSMSMYVSISMVRALSWFNVLWCCAVLSWFSGRQLHDSFSTLWEIEVFCVVGGVGSLRWNLKELTEGHHLEWSLRLNLLQHGKTIYEKTRWRLTDWLLFLDSTGGVAWPFSVGRVICLVVKLSG